MAIKSIGDSYLAQLRSFSTKRRCVREISQPASQLMPRATLCAVTCSGLTLQISDHSNRKTVRGTLSERTVMETASTPDMHACHADSCHLDSCQQHLPARTQRFATADHCCTVLTPHSASFQSTHSCCWPHSGVVYHTHLLSCAEDGTE